jgi:hypothetical protein
MIFEPPTGTSRRSFLQALMGLAGAGVPVIGKAAPRKILVQRSPLAGFQYHEGERLWPRLRPGQPVTLVREPGNRFDPNAVRVDWQGEKLGYLPRRENAAVSQMMDRGERLTGRIAHLGEGPWPWERVSLDVHLEVGP